MTREEAKELLEWHCKYGDHKSIMNDSFKVMEALEVFMGFDHLVGQNQLQKTRHLFDENGNVKNDTCKYCNAINPGRTIERGFARCNKCGEPSQ